MDEQNKDAALDEKTLDEETLENVAGGGTALGWNKPGTRYWEKAAQGITRSSSHDEEKKDAALDEEALESVTGGGVRDWINQAWEKINGTDNNKENQP